jgi:hypothetical protein
VVTFESPFELRGVQLAALSLSRMRVALAQNAGHVKQ